MDIASLARFHRIQNDLSQDELAAKAHLSRTYLSLIERGKATNISRLVIAKLAQALDMSQSDFVQPTIYDDCNDSLPRCIIDLESILARLKALRDSHRA